MSHPKLTTYIAILGVACAFVCAGCGEAIKKSVGIAPTGKTCVVADVSDSTKNVRGDYVTSFNRYADDAARNASGALCVVLAAGKPQADSPGTWVNLAPANRYASNATQALKQNVDRVTAQFASILEDPGPARGSALIEGAYVGGSNLQEGDTLLILTDGIENSNAFGDMHELDLTPAGVERLLDRVEAAGMMPDLRGQKLVMPMLLVHRDGIGMTAEKLAQVRQFWRAYAERAGTQISAENGGEVA